MKNEDHQEDIEKDVDLVEEQTSKETDNEEVDNTQDEEMEQEDNNEEEQTEEPTKSQKEIELEKRLEAERLKNKKLFARVKRTSKKEEKPQEDTLDLAEYFATGGTREGWENLKTIAKAKDLTIAEAKEDPLYKAYLAQKEIEKKDEKAQIKSSGVVPKGSNFKSGMSEEDHRKAWEKKMNG